jgi:capsular polysaccharide transport system permease protein
MSPTKHVSIVVALIIRDLMGRFGRQHLGFVWTVLEPMILTSGVMIVWSLIKEPVIHGVPIIAFVLTGYMPLTLWRHLTNPLVKILRLNASLLYHRPLSIVHLISARIFLEFFSISAAASVVYFVVLSVGMIEPIEDWGLTFAAWALAAWFFGAIGVVFAAMTEMWEPAEKFIQPSQYLMLPISGVYFMLDWLPHYAQNLLMLNPTDHVFEMFRAGFLGPGIQTHYDAGYLIACSLALTLLGASLMRGIRTKIQFN